jgi:hypothetical protein
MATKTEVVRSSWNQWTSDREPMSDADAIEFVVSDPEVLGDMLRSLDEALGNPNADAVQLALGREALTHYVAALKEAEPQHYEVLEQYGAFKNVFSETK